MVGSKRICSLLLLLAPCAGLVRGFNNVNDPRSGVIGTLFGQQASRLNFLKSGYGKRKEVVLRWRIAQHRSMVERCAREIGGLEQRLGYANLSPAEENAHRVRVAVLRRDAGVEETAILRLKQRVSKVVGQDASNSRPGLLGAAARQAEIFSASEERSAKVLLSQLRRRKDPWELLREDTSSLLRLGTNFSLAAGYLKLRQSPTLLPHTAAIIARAATLERHAPGILLAVDGYLELVEPHLDTILDRLDEIEPHMPFVLENLDALAPHTGTILDHFDALMLYADEQGKYLQVLLPWLPTFAPHFDALGPHLAVLRPHLPKILPHLKTLAPYAPRFAPHVVVSANADILIFYFGWVLRIPFLRKFVLKLSFLPRLAAFLARRLPRRPVRGRTADLQCDFDSCDVVQYEARLAASRTFGAEAGEVGLGAGAHPALGDARSQLALVVLHPPRRPRQRR